MPKIANRLKQLGLVLPAPMQVPKGVVLNFPWVNIRGNRAYVSGHGPLELDGSLAGPFGQVGSDVSVKDATKLAEKTGLAMLASLQAELGDLDRITGWCSILGMVNSAPGFAEQPTVINGFTDMILNVFGPGVGSHSRSAVGMAALPMKLAVEIEGVVEFT
jgi:hypothetical protein